MAIQETKSKEFSKQWIADLWGLSNFGFAQKEANGRSGGLLIIWDSDEFSVNQAVGNDNYLAIKGKWKRIEEEIVFVNAYGPHIEEKKIRFWNDLNFLVNSVEAAWCLCGDFNEVRNPNERFNCNFIESGANNFNGFIMNSKLIEIPMGGKKFTRFSDDGIKFSKLDRFLVNDCFRQLWKDLSVIPLDRKVSDHCPIVLRDKVIDFGPKPFRIFDT